MTTENDPSTIAAPRDPFGAALRGFGPVGLLAMVAVFATPFVWMPLAGALVLWWARRSGTPWSAIGFVRPRSWAATVVGAIVFGVALKLALKSLVMPLLGADPINRAYHHLAGNPAAALAMLPAVTLGAGFGEETIWRGFLYERGWTLLGRRVWSTVVIVLVTSVLFGIAHYPVQGLAGAQQATIVGIVLGTIYARTGSLWFPMIAHAAFDVAAVAIIYWNRETEIARWFFRG